MEVNCDSGDTRTFGFGMSRVKLIWEQLVEVISYAYPVFQFSQFLDLRNARDLSHKVVRQIQLALYCDLGARRVDLVGDSPSMKEVKEGLLRTRNQ